MIDMSKRALAGWRLIAVVLTGMAAFPILATAHGERNQEPFLRMRTVHWYDVKWSTGKMNVNDEIVLEGKFQRDW